MRGSYFTLTPSPQAVVTTDEGGRAFQSMPLDRLHRFLILGSLGQTFYASEREVTKDNIDAVTKIIADEPSAAVEMIRRVSDEGLAPKNEPAIVALALAIASPNIDARHLAYRITNDVARTGTDILHLFAYTQKLRGSSKGYRKMFERWYTMRSLDNLALQLLKYRQRDGMSHRNVLRDIRPTPSSEAQAALFRLAVEKHLKAGDRSLLPNLAIGWITAHENTATTPARAAAIVREYRLTHEMIPTEWKQYPEVWDALLIDMPMHAMLRNLGNLASRGLLVQHSVGAMHVIGTLANEDVISRSRLHPLTILLARAVYAGGRSIKGSGVWTPNPEIEAALEAAFYAAFKNVTPTEHKIVLAVDTSGSMMNTMAAGLPLKCGEVAACMALVTARTEPNAEVILFDHAMYHDRIRPEMTITEAVAAVNRRGGGTYTHLVPTYLRQRGEPIDGLVFYTDSVTASGDTQGVVRQMRNEWGTRAVTAATAANAYTILRDDDPYCLNVVGFDASAPQVIADFIAGRI